MLTLQDFNPDGNFGEFKTILDYYAAMDYLLYLTEDVSYRADRVDSLLWHPYKEEIVGIKIKGFQSIEKTSQSLEDILRANRQPDIETDAQYEKAYILVKDVCLEASQSYP